MPNGMPIPAHLVANLQESPENNPPESVDPPSHMDFQNYENADYGAVYENFVNTENNSPNYEENIYDQLLSFEEPQLSYDDFIFEDEPEIPLERSTEHYFDGMKSDQNEEIIKLDLTVPDTPPLTPPSTSIHPERGTFNLESALKQSRNNGFGSAVRLRFAGTSLSNVDPIYLCSKRSGEQCCEDKNPECFTPGGCFCDSSCRAFDDCCPDFEDHCADKSCLENLKTDIVSNYLRNLRRRPENLKDLPSIASGGQPKHVEPNACCNGRPFNHGLRCCCSGHVTDECPCKSGT